MTTDIERVPVNIGRQINGLDEAFRLSKNLAVASVLPTALRGKPSDVLAIVLYGQDLGLSPMQAIQGIYVVEGRPSLASQTWLALLRRAGHRARVVEHTETSCTVHLVRGDTGEEHTETYSIDDAVHTGKVKIVDGKLVARSKEGKVLPWEAHTKRLLLARAVSNAARFLCPEVALGFYSEAEVEEWEHTEPVASPRIEPEPIDAEVVEQSPEEVAADLADIEQEFTNPLSYSEQEIEEGS